VEKEDERKEGKAVEVEDKEEDTEVTCYCIVCIRAICHICLYVCAYIWLHTCRYITH